MRPDVWMGSVAAQDQYNPDEGDFQWGVRQTPWFNEFVQHYGEEPDLNTKDYDTRGAWKAGIRPDIREPSDNNMLHWDSRFKSDTHPNRYVGGVDTKTGQPAVIDPLATGGDAVLGGILNATGNVAKGLYRDIPRAANWFYQQAGKPEAEAQADTRNVIGGLAEQLYTLPQRAIGASQDALDTGNYNPAPAVETALTVMGGGVGGAGKEAGAVVGSGPTKGIRAYHSSPHDFDKFDLSKIGTGEGAQAYGHGLYFAESPAVSGQGGQYWQQFKQHPNFTPAEAQAAIELHAAGFDRDKAKQLLSQRMKEEFAPYGQRGREEAQLYKEHLDALDLLHSNKPVGPRTYEVNINADPAHMLDWDKALSGQSEAVRKAVIDAAKARPTNGPLSRAINQDLQAGNLALTGEQAYSGIGGLGGNRKVATQALSERGIPGIKYLDQGSRAPQWNVMPVAQGYGSSAKGPWAAKQAGKPVNYFDSEKAAREFMAAENARNATSNYVIFDPGIIDILKKYGIAGAAPAGMGALAAQDRYE